MSGSVVGAPLLKRICGLLPAAPKVVPEPTKFTTAPFKCVSVSPRLIVVMIRSALVTFAPTRLTVIVVSLPLSARVPICCVAEPEAAVFTVV